MSGFHPQDLYNDSSSRSPPSIPTHSTHGRPSRQLDSFSSNQNGAYNLDEQAPPFDPSRYVDRMNAPFNAYNTFDGMPQAWNSNTFPQNNNLAALGTTTRVRLSNRGRSALPSTWFDQPQQNAPTNGFFNYQQGGHALNDAHIRSEGQPPAEIDEELIPTAIVIKNIPFAVKKEQLVQLMTDLNLPLPYAFNYHFDNGIFRGLAFANFQSPHETAAVIERMNHLEIQGRKLRVEYKKMLPQAERDRIEREKRERRGQLEEQHRPMASTALQNQPSVSSLASHVPATSPSPISARRGNHPDYGVDMNDPLTLKYYSQLLVFRADQSAEASDVMTFPTSLSPSERRIVHGLAHMLQLGHQSQGSEDGRYVQVFRTPSPSTGRSPPLNGPLQSDAHRRQLNRAATTDFTNVRHPDPTFYGGALGTQSTGYLGFTDTQGGLSVGTNLRSAKSHADLRSFTPSPAASATSFPAGLSNNVSRFQEYGQSSPGSSRSNLTPTGTTLPGANDAMLANGMNSMTLNNGLTPAAGSPHRLRGMVSWDRDERSAPGPIGGHRGYSGNHDDRTRGQGAPTRSSRGPQSDRSNGFVRGRQDGHRPRGSDELSSPGAGVEIVVE